MTAEGLVHVYCGDGKGKTSAAIGLAVRAAGSGLRVLFARFLKTEDSGELSVLDQVDGIDVIRMPRSYGFFPMLDDRERAEACAMYGELWERVVADAVGGAYDVLVIDEFMAACSLGLIAQGEALAFLRDRPAGLEVVLTGRDPSSELLELADYVSEIRKVRHPFDRGVKARRGIEY